MDNNNNNNNSNNIHLSKVPEMLVAVKLVGNGHVHQKNLSRGLKTVREKLLRTVLGMAFQTASAA